MIMFSEMSKSERKQYLTLSLQFLKRIKETNGPHGLAAAYSKRAHEERFRKLWKNRHNDKFNYDV